MFRRIFTPEVIAGGVVLTLVGLVIAVDMLWEELRDAEYAADGMRERLYAAFREIDNLRQPAAAPAAKE
jgi:hypothetical protein